MVSSSFWSGCMGTPGAPSGFFASSPTFVAIWPCPETIAALSKVPDTIMSRTTDRFVLIQFPRFDCVEFTFIGLLVFHMMPVRFRTADDAKILKRELCGQYGGFGSEDKL